MAEWAEQDKVGCESSDCIDAQEEGLDSPFNALLISQTANKYNLKMVQNPQDKFHYQLMKSVEILKDSIKSRLGLSSVEPVRQCLFKESY